MNSGMKKSLITLVAVAVVAMAIVIVGPVIYRIFTAEGPRTGEIDMSVAEPATTDRNGTWHVAAGDYTNNTSVGFTFAELLPGSERVTSGSTHDVTGEFIVKNDELVDGQAIVDMTTLRSDIEKRDINVRMKIFSTDVYPEAKFEVAGKTDLSVVPDSGEAVDIKVPGRLTIRGVTNDVEVPLKVMRSADKFMMSGNLKINRLDYNVRTPDFVAASVDEEGEVNLRFVLTKDEQ
ncbi:YceI family protein [Corynebacterium sp. H78]|uniref:YceI family protein n=1 Tax=Corynebacterium sp. H78 TaxID=3133417 RepID=UPI0030A81A00